MLAIDYGADGTVVIVWRLDAAQSSLATKACRRRPYSDDSDRRLAKFCSSRARSLPRLP